MLHYTIELRLGAPLSSNFLFTQDTGHVTAPGQAGITHLTKDQYSTTLKQVFEFLFAVRATVGPPELGVGPVKHTLDASQQPAKVENLVDFPGLNNYKEVYQAGDIALHPRPATDLVWSDFVLWYAASERFYSFIKLLP